MGQPTERQIREGLEKTQRGTQQETKRYPTTKRESPAGTKDNKRGARSDETNEEKKDDGGTTREEETKSRRIPEGLSGNHKDYPGTMVRA